MLIGENPMRLQLICLIALAGALYSSAAQAQQTVVVPNLNCGVTLDANFSATYTLDRSDLYEGDIANGSISITDCSDGTPGTAGAGSPAAFGSYRTLCDGPYAECYQIDNPFSYYVYYDLYNIYAPGTNPRGPNGDYVELLFYENGTTTPEFVNNATFGISFYDNLATTTATYPIYDSTGDARTIGLPPMFYVTVHPDNSTDLGGDVGSSSCEGTCGMPINLTNGNTWIKQQDYSLPGLGGGLNLSRTWNSLLTLSKPVSITGMFGDSWRSNYEESLQTLPNSQIKYWRGDGSAWTFTWNSTAQAYALTYPTNEYVTLTFNTSTTLFTLTYKNGNKEIFSNGGTLSSLMDRNGNQTSLSYDGSNRLVQVTAPAGNSLTFTYGNSSFPAQVTGIQDAVGTIATYTYATGGYLTSATYADGSVVNYTSDQNGLITNVTDANGKTLESHTYNGSRQGLTSSKANGVDALSLSYGPSGATLTDSLGNVTLYSPGQRIARRNFIGSISGSGCDSCGGRGNYAYGRDSVGNLVYVTDPLGHWTGYTNDSNGNVLTKTVALNAQGSSSQTWNYTYNGFGEVLTASDPLGRVTTNTYDTNGNLLTTTTPSPSTGVAGSETTFTYDTKGELLTTTDPRSNRTTVAYTTGGLVSSITDAQSKVTQFQYDPRGNRTAVIDALNQQTSFSYDVMNRLKKITYPTTPSTFTQFAYDYRGRKISATDPNGKLTQYAYDDADRLISVTDPNNGITQYGYDTENNLIGITDASGNKTAYQHDAFGRVTQTSFPSGLTEAYSYDADNNLLSKTDRNGHTINYSYDYVNRLSEKQYPDSTSVNYVYDLANRLTQVSDPTGTYGFTYDNMDRLTQTSTAYTFISGKTFTTASAYDASSNRTSMSDPQSNSTSYVYDTLNRLSTFTYPSRTNYTFTYDALGRRTQLTRPNGVATNYQYDTLSRLSSVLHQISSRSGTTTLDGATYVYDAASNRTSKTDNRTSVTSSLSYDPLYEVTQVVQGSNTTESYSYDAVGNRLSSLGVPSYSYNGSNELNSDAGMTYTYDNNGNRLTMVASGATTTYTWDFENRLASVVLPGSGGTVSFKYDPLGRRIQKTSPSGTTNYLYDGSDLLEEIDTGGNLLGRYIPSGLIDEPLAVVRGKTTSYYEADALGSITSLSSSTGALANTYTYDSFGKLTASSGTVTNSYEYTGRQVDAEIGLYYYRARYYDPAIGRFIGEDPIRWGGGQNNFYTYVKNSPTNYVDPWGLRIVVAGGNMADYQQAVTYLNGDSGMANIIHDLDASSTTYTIVYNNADDDSYDPSTHMIHWDPHSALRCSGGGKQTPALGLGHEMAHADQPWYWDLIGWVPWPGYDNLEERRVIVGPETDAAHTLGEGTRTDHGGTTYTVPSPISK